MVWNSLLSGFSSWDYYLRIWRGRWLSRISGSAQNSCGLSTTFISRTIFFLPPRPPGSWLPQSELLMANTSTCYSSGAAVEQWGCFNHTLREDLGNIAFSYSSSWSFIRDLGGRKTQFLALDQDSSAPTQKPNSQAGAGFGCPLWDCADTAPPSLGNKYFLHCLMDFPTLSWTAPMNTCCASAGDGLRVFTEHLSPGRNHALFSLHLGKLISTFFFLKIWKYVIATCCKSWHLKNKASMDAGEMTQKVKAKSPDLRAVPGIHI